MGQQAKALSQIVGIKLDGRTRFTWSKVAAIVEQLAELRRGSNMVDQKAKERLQPILAEFRKGVAHQRAAGATEQRIQTILAASIRLAVHEVDDPELCAWLCDEFSKAAHVAPIVTNYPASRTLH